MIAALKKMSRLQKLQTMEALWTDLSQDGRMKSPAWHEELLVARKERLAGGKSKFSPWSEAKERIRKRVRAS